MSASQALHEKRFHPRVSVDLPISCEQPGSEAIVGTAKDLGLGGMFIESSERPAFGSSVTILIRLPQTKTEARLPAIVRWSTEQGFGVQFQPLGARETYAISALLTY